MGDTICGGLVGGVPFADSVTFTASSTIPGGTYQFFFDTTPASAQQVTNTFTTSSFSIYDTDLSFIVGVEQITASGCSSTATMTVSVNYVNADNIQIAGGAVSQNICNGTAPGANFVSVGAEDAPDGTDDFTDGADYPLGAAITYQWENRTTGGWSAITGANARNYTAPILYQDTEYRRRSVSTLNGMTCEEVSNIITINVAGALAGGEVQRNNGGVWIDQTEIICVGDSPQLLRIINDTAGPGVDYQWQYSTDNAIWQDITIANGYAADANALQYQPDPVTIADIRSIHTLRIVGPVLGGVGNFYRITVGADVFTVSIGEDNSTDIPGGDGNVNTIVEVIQYLAFKINDSGSGITATQDGVDTITYTLAPGSTLTPVIRVDVGGVDVTGPANSVANQTYNGQGNTRFYRRSISQNFGGAILPLCQTFSDVHTVEVNTIIPGSIDNTNSVVCYGNAPGTFTSKRNAYSTAIGATISYEWYRTNDVARTNWVQIPGATNQDLTYTTTLTISTSFRRTAASSYGAGPSLCSSNTTEFTVTVLDEVNAGNILADQDICRVDGAPLTVNVADLVNIVATGVETDDGVNDGISYQWQFSVDNINWDDVTAGARPDLLTGGFAATLNGTTITAAQQDADIERRLQTLIDPDIATKVYYRLTTTRFNDANNNNVLDGGELQCEVISPITEIDIAAQPTIVQTGGPANTQTVCTGDAIAPIVFTYGGSATGVLVTGNGSLNVANDPVAKTVTISGTPNNNYNIALRTTGTTCEIEFLNYTVIRVLNRPAPDYITIDDAPGGNPPDPIIDNQDANIYDGQQLYLCEAALNTGPANTLFGVCYNDGRVPPANGYLWQMMTPGAGSINPVTGEVDWNDGFFGDATIRVYAYACDGTTPAAFREATVTVNEFNSAATQPTEPVPLLEAEVERVTISPDPGGAIRAGERYNITLNGVRYTFETTDVAPPIDGNADQNALQIAQALVNRINDDITSPVGVSPKLFSVASPTQFFPGDINNNGLADDVGAFITITAQYDGNSAPPILPGSPRGYGGDMSLNFSVTPAPTEARAFGNMTGIEINETSAEICGTLTGAEPICQTTAATPNTEYFSSSSFYTDIRYAISSVVPGPSSVASPGVIGGTTGIFDWNPGFHGTFNIESYATGCNGLENPTPGVHNVRIYPDLDPPTDITFDPLTLPDCPAQAGATTDFNSSNDVTWSWNNESAGTINSVTGVVTWRENWSGTVVITATSFGCGGGSLNRTITIPGSPDLSRVSPLATMNQTNICVGTNVVTITHEIIGSATGVDVTGLPSGVNENVFSRDQIERITISNVLDEDNDIHNIEIDGVLYTVETGEDNSVAIAGGDGDVDTLAEVLELLEDKINDAAIGITADDSGGVLTLTSNGFDFSATVSLTDFDANDGQTIGITQIQNGGRFVEISGAPNVVITERTSYPFTIRTTGSVCTPDEVTGNITVNPLSTIAIRLLPVPSDDDQEICNNSVNVLDPIIYDVTNATSVDVVWAPSRPPNIDARFSTQNQISTILLGGVDADIAANDGQNYTVTINSTTVTYTVDINPPQSDNQISDIVAGLAAAVNGAGLNVDAIVTGGNTLQITSRNGADFTITQGGPTLNAAQLAAPVEVQPGERIVTVSGDPVVPGLITETVYTYTITTQNSEFGCNLPGDQQTVSGRVTIFPEPTITLISGNDPLDICLGETVLESTTGNTNIVYEITGFATNATITPTTGLPPGLIGSFQESPTTVEISITGDELNLDPGDRYTITINGSARNVDIAAPALDEFSEIIQAFDNDIDNNVAGVTSTISGTTLIITSLPGASMTVARTNPGGAGDPVLTAPNQTQAGGKFYTISGTATGTAGIFNYIIQTSGGACNPVNSIPGVIRVNEPASIVPRAGFNPNPDNICNLSPMNAIEFVATNVVGYTVSWTGVNGAPPGVVLTRPNPTTLELRSNPIVNVPGLTTSRTYQYRIITTSNVNSCNREATFDGILTVVSNVESLTFDTTSTGSPTDVDGGGIDLSGPQDYVMVEICQDTPLTDVRINGSSGISTVALAAGSVLPSGLIGNWNPVTNIYTINGTPDTATDVTLTLEATTYGPLVAPCSPADDIRVRIVVYSTSTIALDPGNNSDQTVCTNTALTNINYTFGSGARGASVVGLPPGLRGDVTGPTSFVISGIPTTALTETTSYTYTITTTGNVSSTSIVGNPCSEVSVTGVITVLPEESLTHDPASGALIQDVCYGGDITPIIFTIVGDNTFATVTPTTSLPSGLNFNYIPDADNMGGVLTLSGSPDAVINTPTTYTVTLTTGAVGNTSICSDDIEVVTITVNPQSALTFTGTDTLLLNQSVCEGNDIQEIYYTLGGGATDVTLNISAPPGSPALGWTRAANIRINDPSDPPNSVVLFGNADPAGVLAGEVTYSYTIETSNPNTCLPEIQLGGTITVFPPITYNNWTANTTENDPLCDGDDGSIVVNSAAISGGVTSQAQQTQVEINNASSVGDQITFNIQGETFTYVVQGFDTGTGNFTNFPNLGDRALSRAEILPLIANLINDPVTGSRYATASANSPTPGIITLVAETAGIPFTTSVTFSLGSTGALIGVPTITVANQTLNYSYYWRRSDSGGNPVTALDVNDPTTYETTTSNGGLTLNILSVNSTEYFVLTTIADGCEVTSPVVSVTAPAPVTLSINSICDTEIISTASGGNGPYVYSIYDSTGTEIGRSDPTNGSHTFTDGDPNRIPGVAGNVNLSAGFQYEVRVTDNNNCGGAGTGVTIRTPLSLNIDNSTINIEDTNCDGNGSITIDDGGNTITGGSAGQAGQNGYQNLTFTWRGTGGFIRNSQNLNNVPPGDYFLTVEDDNCTSLTATSDTFRILPNSLPVINTPPISITPSALCSDGHIEVSLTGVNTSTTVNYQWINQYGATLEQGNFTLATSNTLRIEDLDAGDYTLRISSQTGTATCTTDELFTIQGPQDGPLRNISNDPALRFDITEILCNGQSGAFTAEFTGGTPPYSYSLNNGVWNTSGFSTGTPTTVSLTIISATGTPVVSTVTSYTTQLLTVNNLPANTYIVKVKDSGGCTTSSGTPVELEIGTINLTEPDVLAIQKDTTNTVEINCSSGIQGSLSISVTGGTVSSTTPYSILWELRGTNGGVLYKRTTSAHPQDLNGFTINNLDYAGDYTVTVTDANGCAVTETINLENGSNDNSPFEVGTPIVTQPGCNSEELGSIELQLSGGAQPYEITWYKLSVAQDSVVSSTSSGSTASSTTTTSTIEFSDGGYVSMNKDGFYLVDNLEAGKYRAIISDASGCEIFTRSGVIKTSEFNMTNQRVYNREILDCDSGTVNADFSFRLSGTSLAYNIFLDGNQVYGGSSTTTGTTSTTFINNIVKQGNTFILRDLSEGRHIVEVQDSSNTSCSLDYAFDIETYVPITFEGETEFEFDVCDSSYEFELDTSQIIGGNPIIDNNDNVIYTLRWTYTPLDPNQPGSSFVGRTNFSAGRGTYQLIISDGTCESDPIDFVFSGDVDVISIDGLLANGEVSQGVSCELGATDGRISIQILGGIEPYDISWEIFDATSPVITPVSSTLSVTSNTSPWRPLDGSYTGLGNFDGFTTLNDLPAGLYRYTVRSSTNCTNSVNTSFNYLRDVISVDDDNTLVITDGPYVDPKLCEGNPGLLILDAVNNSDSNSSLNFFYIDTNGTDDPGDDGQPVPLNGNTTKLDEDTYQILIDQPFDYGKLVITTNDGCGVETKFNLALGDPYFSYTSPSFEQVNEIPARESVTFIDESEGEFSRLEWNFGDNSEPVVINITGTQSGVTQVTHAYGNSGTYYPTLTIYNELGCYDSVTNPITIGRGYSIYTPNVFTPNSDCLNDFYRPLFTGFERLTFNIYDNKGNLIYTEEAQDGSVNMSACPNEIDTSGNGKAILGWDGKRMDGSVLDSFSPYYIYSVEGIPLNRVTPDQVIERSGIFTVLK